MGKVLMFPMKRIPKSVRRSTPKPCCSPIVKTGKEIIAESEYMGKVSSLLKQIVLSPDEGSEPVFGKRTDETDLFKRGADYFAVPALPLNPIYHPSGRKKIQGFLFSNFRKLEQYQFASIYWPANGENEMVQGLFRSNGARKLIFGRIEEPEAVIPYPLWIEFYLPQSRRDFHFSANLDKDGRSYNLIDREKKPIGRIELNFGNEHFGIFHVIKGRLETERLAGVVPRKDLRQALARPKAKGIKKLIADAKAAERTGKISEEDRWALKLLQAAEQLPFFGFSDDDENGGD